MPGNWESLWPLNNKTDLGTGPGAECWGLVLGRWAARSADVHCAGVGERNKEEMQLITKEKNKKKRKKLMSCTNWHRANPQKIINMVRLRRALLKCLSKPLLSNGFIG